jgi:protocatechuate 3,4-dioxygenase beta subunit
MAKRRRLGVERLEQRCVLSAQIAGSVWHDLDDDGRFEYEGPQFPAEHPVPDVTVQLLNQSLAIVERTATDENGWFEFLEIHPGGYTLEFEAPDGAVFTKLVRDTMDGGQVGQGAIIDSSDGSASGSTGPFRVGADEFVGISAGIRARSPAASVRGRVWDDQNGNGIRDVTEPGIAEVEVQLEHPQFGRLVETYTNVDGIYQFDGQYLLPGSYQLEFKRPPRNGGVRWEFTEQVSGDEVDRAFDSDVSGSNGKTEALVLSSTETSESVRDVLLDAGFFRAGRVEGSVWHDLDRNGSLGNVEYGVEGVQVELLDELRNVVASALTDSTGRFRFLGLKSGVYTVEFPAPAEFSFSTVSRGNAQRDDITGQTVGRTAPFPLAQGERKTDVFAGLYTPFGADSVRGRVWRDLDADGVQDSGEPGIAGAEVVLENTSRQPLRAVATDGSGNYVFDGATLLPGEYVVDFATGDVIDLRSGRIEIPISPRNVRAAPSSLADSDAQPTNGKTRPFTLAPPTADAPLADVIRDAGFYEYGRIEGTVWDDVNHDGIWDRGEPGAPRVLVKLYDAHQNLLASKHTGLIGTFAFTDLVPANYRLQFVTRHGTTFSPQRPVLDGQTVSQADPFTGTTAPITATSGETVRRFAGAYGESFDTLVSGVAWDDVDGDGIRDDGEPGLPGVEVQLLDFNHRPTATTLTQSNGRYEFAELPPGVYSIEVAAPEGTTISPMNRGEDDVVDSDVNRASGRTVAFSLISGQQDPTQNVGIYRGPFSKDNHGFLRITEVGFTGHGNTEFVEVKNVGGQPLDLTGVSFTDGIRFQFSVSAITKLFPGEHAVVVGDTETLARRIDVNEINVAGEYEKKLDRDETLTLVDAEGDVVLDFRYDDDWFIIMDNEFEPWTLTVVDERAPADEWKSQSNWRPSSRLAGSPGTDDPRITPDPGAIVINELLARSTDGFNDRIEIHNTTGQDIDIGNWYLGDSDREAEPLYKLTRYRIEPGTIVPAGGFVTFSREQHFANPSDPGLNSKFGLSSFGEAVHIVAGDPFGNLLGYANSADFFGSEIDVSFGRHVTSTGAGIYTPMTATSFGDGNSSPRVGPIVMDEIMYNPAADGDEYVRLRNVSDADVDLSAGGRPWSLSVAIDYQFTPGATVPAGGSAYVVPILPAEFRSKHAVPEDIPVFGPYDGKLSNGGDDLQLFRHDQVGRRILIDRVEYHDDAPWPAEADLGGVALVRVSPIAFGNDPASWTHSAANSAPSDELTIEGKFRWDVASAAEATFAKTVNLWEGSALELYASGRAASNGEIFRQILAADDVRGRFSIEPEPGEHLGSGLFVGEATGTGSSVVYFDTSAWVLFRQAAFGDANGDGHFDQFDMVQIIRGEKYLTAEQADWTEGDFSGDGGFDQRDLVLALQTRG